MITSMELRPTSGSNVTINDAIYPVHGFDPEVELDETVKKKMQQVGVWPTYSYPGAMHIPLEGHILGNGASDAARASDVMSKRAALMDACLPPLTGTYTSRVHGVLRVQYDHWAETADVQYHCVAFRAPLEALDGTNIPFFITLLGFTPYFIGTGTQTLYLP